MATIDRATTRGGSRRFTPGELAGTNSQAYGPDVVELAADVTRAAQSPAPAPRTSHRATG